MTMTLKQVPVNCPTCGDFIWRCFRSTYDISQKQTEVEEVQPFCQFCRRREFFEVLRVAQKIEPLVFEKNRRGNFIPPKGEARDFGKKVEDAVNRHEPVTSELVEELVEQQLKEDILLPEAPKAKTDEEEYL